MAFGYKNTFGGKSLSFGSAFPNSPTLNQNTQLGAVGQDSYFDKNTYGGDIRARNKAVGRMAAGSMGMSLTDAQLENLGAGISSIKDLTNLKTTVTPGGHIGSANYQGALTDDKLNNYIQSGDLLGATGFGGQDAGSAFGTLKANAAAAQAANDQTAYANFTNPSHLYALGDLASRTMGGVGLSMFGNAIDDSISAGRLGNDPFNVDSGMPFGQGQQATWGVPHTGGTETGAGQPTVEGNAHSTTPDVGHDTGGNITPPAPQPQQPMGLDDVNQRFQAIESAFEQAQGSKPDNVQYNHLNQIANERGLEAALEYARNNIITKAMAASGQKPPKIRNSQDAQGAGSLYDFIVNALGPGAINQPRDEYVRNILGLYAKYGQ